MDKFFKISERGSTVRNEIVGGITTFFAMAYIIFVNPNMLCVDLGDGFFPAMPGDLWVPVMVATCASAAIGCFLTAMLANVPFAQAPGMGLNAFFTYTVCLGMGYTWQEGLAIVLMAGIIFLVISISPLRSKIIESIPAFLKSAISAGIGLFIAFIGLLNVNLISFSSGVPALNFADNAAGILALIGLLITIVLVHFQIKGAVLIGIIATWLLGMLAQGIGWYVVDVENGVYSLIPSSIVSLDFSGLKDTAFKFNFGWAFSNFLQFVAIVVSFLYVDLFDTVGTVVGVASKADLLDEDGKLPRAGKVLLADAIGTTAGACLGTSTITSFVESTAGVAAGGRTGLTALTTGVWFLLALIFSPIFLAIPSFATAPALIYVGMLMLSSVTKMKFDGDLADAVGGYLAVVIMPLSYSIATGIMFAMMFWVLIKVCTGKSKDVSPVMWVIFAIFALRILAMVTSFS